MRTGFFVIEKGLLHESVADGPGSGLGEFEGSGAADVFDGLTALECKFYLLISEKFTTFVENIEDYGKVIFIFIKTEV